MKIVNCYFAGQEYSLEPFVFISLVLLSLTGIAVWSIADDPRQKHIGEIIIISICLIAELFTVILCFKDSRHPRVEALIDDKVPFEEINKTYEYLYNEGDLRVFNVREGTEEYNKLMKQLKEQK